MEKNKALLLKFDRDLVTEDYSDKRRYKILVTLKKIAEYADFNFDEAEEENLRDLVAEINGLDLANRTKQDYRKILKRFYRWINRQFERETAPKGYNGKDEHPEVVDWIPTHTKNGSDKLPKDLLTPEDVDDLIKAAHNLRDKALIALLWDTGARYSELMDLKVGDIEDREHGKKVVVEGKTGSRRIPLRESVPYLNKWLSAHPSGEKDAPLFCKLQNPGETPSHYYVNSKMLKKAAEKAGLDKPTNPHHFRHSRASFLANKFTEAQLCEWFGWVQGSDVPAKYVHLSGRDIDKAFNQMHGIEEEDEDNMEDRTQECPRCEEINEAGARFCMRCGQALNQEAAQTLEKRRKKSQPPTPWTNWRNWPRSRNNWTNSA